MAIPSFTLKTTPSPLTKENIPLTIFENTFLFYSSVFFQTLLDLDAPYYYYSTSAEINADFKRFCQTYNISYMKFDKNEVHSLATSIRDKLQFVYPSEFAQMQTDQWNGKGICFSKYQLKFLVAATKTVLNTYSEVGKQVAASRQNS